MCVRARACVRVCVCVCQDARAHKLDLTVVSAAMRIWYVHLLVCMNFNELQTTGAVGRHHKHFNIMKKTLAKRLNAYYETYYEHQRN